MVGIGIQSNMVVLKLIPRVEIYLDFVLSFFGIFLPESFLTLKLGPLSEQTVNMEPGLNSRG